MTVQSLGVAVRRSPVSRAMRRALPVAGPAFAVSVGYVDPGNWATDLAAGRYGATLLWVVLLASLIAIVLQVVVARLTFATEQRFGVTLAERMPALRTPFFFVAQAGAVATDLAELTGVAVGLHLLTGLPTAAAAVPAALVVLALLALGDGGLQRLEIILIAFVALIAGAYLYEVWLLHPAPLAMLKGALIPSIPEPNAIVVLVGIVGATVMPHNIFLHSSSIAARFPRPAWRDAGAGVRWCTRETVVALSVAMFVNAAILVVGAEIGGAGGSIEHAYHTIAPVAGSAAAAIFGLALLCSGIAASTTATVAGDTIAADLSPWRIPRLLRRLLTLGPGVALLAAGSDPTSLLIWSQVGLSLVLPAVLVPLVALSARPRIMREFRLPRALLGAAVAAAALCIVFDLALLVQPLIVH